MDVKEVKKESVLVNEELMERAFNFGVYKTREEVINKALEKFVEYQEGVRKLISNFGTVEYDGNYNPKDFRAR